VPGSANTALTLGAGITISGHSGTIGQDGVCGGALGSLAVTNLGTIHANGAGGNVHLRGDIVVNLGTVRVGDGGRLNLPFAWTNLATFEALSGGTLDVAGSIAADDDRTLVVQPTARLELTGNLLGDAQQTNRFSPSGTLVFKGTGNGITPQFFEIMSPHLGDVDAGFAGQFAVAALILANNTYVRLVDLSDNSPGGGGEALYVNAVVVPAGCTLDLNGLPLYARATQISGAVLGGTITILPDSGPLTSGTPAVAALVVPGELDEWTFNGQSGESYLIVVDSDDAVVPVPHLEFVEATVLGPLGNIIARGSNNLARGTLSLADVMLPLNGDYRIQIKAPGSQPSSIGNYQISLRPMTARTAPLVLNQTVHGRIATPLNLDRWTFSGVAGQQVHVTLINASAPGIAFTLRGPNGWVGFGNATSDSGLVTLPSSGSYVISAYTLSSTPDLDYAFKVEETQPIEMVLGEAFTGQFVGSGQAQLFRIDLSGNQPFRISLQNVATNNRVELYAGFGQSPTRGSFTFGDAQGPGANREITVDAGYSGTYYVLVYADSIGTYGQYTLTVESAALFLSKLSPSQSGNGSVSIVEIEGVGLRSNAQVTLERPGTSVLASSVSWISSKRMVAEIDLTSVPANEHHIRVRQGTESATLPFTVTGGMGALFEARLITPSGVGLNTVNTLYVEYANKGDMPMVAPLLLVRGDGFGKPMFSLDSAQLGRDFWAASQPTVSAEQVSVFATGRIPGILLPGESGRVPVHFLGIRPLLARDAPGGLGVSGTACGRIIGWRLVDASSVPAGGGGCGFGTILMDSPADLRPPFTFRLLKFLPPSTSSIGSGQSQPDQPLNWQSLRENVPPKMDPAAWQAIWMNYTNAAGNTMYSFFGMLEQNVNYLHRLGLLGTAISKTDDLIGFEIAQTDGLHMLRTLATATDGFAPAPGLRLSFERNFPNTISARHRLGVLGRGWTHNWEEHLSTNSVGEVVISGPGAAQRIFKPDVRGGYLNELGDYARLTSLPGGAFRLTEKGGLAKEFHPDGKSNFISDPNGNRITCVYTGDRLTRLAHSSGSRLDFSYTPAGQIATISDAVGRVTHLTYDASGEHLTAAQYFDGRVMRYEYSIGNGAQREHALNEVEFPDQSHQYFLYYARGRLQQMSRDGGAESTTFTESVYGNSFGALAGQATQHECGHGNVEHGFGMLRLGFIIPHQAALFHKPAKGPLHHPATRQHLEAHLILRPFDNVQMQAAARAQGFHPGHQRPRITAVGPDLGQFAIPAHATLQERSGPVPILFIGRPHIHSQQQAQHIHQDMAFAPRDLLACIVTAHAPLITDFDRLAVQHGGGGAGATARGDADRPAQDVMDAEPEPAFDPAPVNIIDRAPGTILVGQQAPSAARALQVAHAIDNAAAIGRRSARFGPGRQQGPDESPFGIRHIRGVAGVSTHALQSTTGGGTETVPPALFVHALTTTPEPSLPRMHSSILPNTSLTIAACSCAWRILAGKLFNCAMTTGSISPA
jgi:YD repeat-containing protein